MVAAILIDVLLMSLVAMRRSGYHDLSSSGVELKQKGSRLLPRCEGNSMNFCYVYFLNYVDI